MCVIFGKYTRTIFSMDVILTLSRTLQTIKIRNIQMWLQHMIDTFMFLTLAITYFIWIYKK